MRAAMRRRRLRWASLRWASLDGARARGWWGRALVSLMGVTARIEASPDSPPPKLPTACLEWEASGQNAGRVGPASQHPATADSPCADANQLTAAVEGILGRRAFVERDCDRRIQGRIERSGSGNAFTAVVRLADREGRSLGERRLHSRGQRCHTLDGPVALVMALMVETEKPESDLAVPVAPPSPERPPPPAWAGSASMQAIAAWGLLPKASVGVAVGVELEPPSMIPFLLEGSYFPSRRSVQDGPGGRFWAWQARLLGCPEWPLGDAVELGVCAGLGLGMLLGTGEGLAVTQPSSKSYVEGEARVVGAIRILGSLSAFAELGAGVPLVHPRFVYLDETDSPSEVHRLKPVVGFAGAGFKLRFSASSSSPPREP